MKIKEGVKELLDEKFHQYNSKGFIDNDPIQIPHLFSRKEDIEIAGFLAATISWGNRKSIITNATKLMALMGNEPFEFVTQHTVKDLKKFDDFVHRTFNGIDCAFFIRSLKNIYTKQQGLEFAFSKGIRSGDVDIKNAIIHFREQFLKPTHQKRSDKHVSNPFKNSSSKRLCMYLRWMVRKDSGGVDFGIWKSINPSLLCLPLDVHTGNVSRKLGLLKRKQDDWKAVEEITNILRQFDPKDPIKYDFALFGIGVSKEI
ncbi:MAG: TIGR02757 family protein [Bacteroidota bacterium]|nr:TIGR02757 family protein [Bacteroidota bacterium]